MILYTTKKLPIKVILKTFLLSKINNFIKLQNDIILEKQH